MKINSATTNTQSNQRINLREEHVCRIALAIQRALKCIQGKIHFLNAKIRASIPFFKLLAASIPPFIEQFYLRLAIMRGLLMILLYPIASLIPSVLSHPISKSMQMMRWPIWTFLYLIASLIVTKTYIDPITPEEVHEGEKLYRKMWIYSLIMLFTIAPLNLLFRAFISQYGQIILNSNSLASSLISLLRFENREMSFCFAMIIYSLYRQFKKSSKINETPQIELKAIEYGDLRSKRNISEKVKKTSLFFSHVSVAIETALFALSCSAILIPKTTSISSDALSFTSTVTNGASIIAAGLTFTFLFFQGSHAFALNKQDLQRVLEQNFKNYFIGKFLFFSLFLVLNFAILSLANSYIGSFAILKTVYLFLRSISVMLQSLATIGFAREVLLSTFSTTGDQSKISGSVIASWIRSTLSKMKNTSNFKKWGTLWIDPMRINNQLKQEKPQPIG